MCPVSQRPGFTRCSWPLFPKADVGDTPVPTRWGISVRCERGSGQVLVGARGHMTSLSGESPPWCHQRRPVSSPDLDEAAPSWWVHRVLSWTPACGVGAFAGSAQGEQRSDPTTCTGGRGPGALGLRKAGGLVGRVADRPPLASGTALCQTHSASLLPATAQPAAQRGPMEDRGSRAPWPANLERLRSHSPSRVWCGRTRA